jgi:symplekin
MEKDRAASAAAAFAANEEASAAKRSKVDSADEDDEDDKEESESDDDDERDKGKKMHDSAVDITEKFILGRLTPGLATELVMRSMFRLPSDIPAHFNSTYTPIAAAGTDGQVKHVSRLLAAQLTSNNLGPGIEQTRMERKRNLR